MQNYFLVDISYYIILYHISYIFHRMDTFLAQDRSGKGNSLTKAGLKVSTRVGVEHQVVISWRIVVEVTIIQVLGATSR